MRTLLLFTMLALTSASTVHAQLLEDFTGGIPATWATFENGTGTSQDWTDSTIGCTGNSATVNYENVTSGLAQDYLVTPLVSIAAANPTMTFDRRESFTSNYGSVLTIEVSSTSQTDAATFTVVETFAEIASGATTCRTETVDLTTYAGTDIYIAFVWTNDDGDRLYLDNVDISPICSDPTATFTVTDDCAVTGNFTVDVNVSDLGGGTDLTLTDDQGSTPQAVTATGSYSFGPYTSGTSVIFTVANDDEAGCSFTSSAQTFICPPSNDECADAEALTIDVGTDGTITGATDSGVDLCDGTEDDDVWYSFVATSTTHFIEIADRGTTSFFNFYHAVHSGTCGALSSEVCSDSDNSTVTGLTVGETYYVQVYSWTSTANQMADFTITVTAPAPPPANDECIDAEALTIDVGTDGTITGATDSGIDLCGGTEDDDVWYSFVATSTTHLIEIADRGTTSFFDFYHAVHSGTCGALSSEVCSDNDNSTVTGLTVGETYYVQVYSWTSTTNQMADFTITVTAPAPPPPNDACAGAIALTDISGAPTAASGATYNSNSTDPAESVDSPNCGTFNGNEDDDLWFTVIAPNGAGDLITVTVDGTPDMVVNLFSGDCENLVIVGCSDGGNPETIEYVVPASRGAGSAPETYYVQAFTYGSGGGEFTVSASTALPVDLISFNGQAMEKTNKLTWSTAREEAADRYVVERSSNANNDWSAIGEVLAAGDSETELFYELMDESPLANAYYRLRMVDLDGTFTFSNIVELTNNTLGDAGLSVFPVPALSEVTVGFEAQAAGKAMIVLTDLTGRTISEQEVNVAAGYNAETVDLQRRASGIYLVRVSVDGRQMVRRVIKR